MSGHTPGPWGAQHVYGTCYSVQCAGGQYHVGTIRGKHTARLIAAAPDLIDALKDLREAVNSRGVIDTVKALKKADAAIAKATAITGSTS